VTAVKKINNWSREAYAFGKARMVALASKAKENKGQALVEYALILALIAVVVILALTFLGKSVNNTLGSVNTSIANAT
jgi:pilus assembly protein Flp/PilA